MDNIRNLVKRLKEKRYRAKLMRRSYIVTFRLIQEELTHPISGQTKEVDPDLS
uniref:Uncharacterized protein n=1 Tax=Candidatus Kentrum sp. UNK TaxID=2126344 RepID=A0A451B6X7_9GAMM|nr:MAG: hypothetical protein BECKUNK1418G_GA0071005_14831 [Candidatus Kentron sp. UNK]VFK74028.1 MAG: hypothetical protein BECKUNK1418H_GA0071006_14761 [Candidatus Kentron sp. UNK]